MSAAIPRLLLLAAVAGGDIKPTQSIQPTCGHLALYTWLRLEGFPCCFGEVLESLGPAPQAGHSLRQLQNSAQALGASLAAYERASGPTNDNLIAYLEPPDSKPHYVVLHARSPRLVQVFDGWKPPYLIPCEAVPLLPGWTGTVLRRAPSPYTSRIRRATLALIGAGVLIGVWPRRPAARPDRSPH